VDNKIQPDHFASTTEAGSELPIGQPSGEEDSSSDDLPLDAIQLLPGCRFSPVPAVPLHELRMTGYTADEEERL
jgi:hypothetical protein